MLINNAGFGSMGDFTKLDLERELNMIDLNVKSLVELTYRFLLADARTQTGSDHQRRFNRGFSTSAFHGDLCSYQSFCALLFGSSLGGESAAWNQGDGALPGRD